MTDPTASLGRELDALYAGVCKAIADPKRLHIIAALREGELSVGDLCDVLDISQSNTSQHLAVLRERGVVIRRREGTSVYYSLSSTKVLAALDLLREFAAEQRATAAVEPTTPSRRLDGVFLG
ncbi:ArsR/SmtB family transcription factor [Nocardioides acrostichi]|uniref:Winged helix-turn-helix transcriptional regulator n=1 Tax=Nocardioides acrostichi TaxID=2784339 RepID=A0A930UYV8_9ACTN|nr:metalloregulator ArsR/SmtB family transcription factor [Nocardioides acrostichi]MBF4160919.1 winged helix-turn-helix transcriptional regulator [Nocardioides acrostichi]